MRYVEVFELYLMRTLTNLEFYIIGTPMKDCSNKRSTRKNGLSVLRVQIYDVFVGRFVNPM